MAMFVVIATASSITYLTVRISTATRVAPLLAALSLPLLAWPNWPYAYQQWSALPYLMAAPPLALLGWERDRPWYLFCAGLACGVAFWADITQSLPVTVALGGAIGLTWVADGRGAARALAHFASAFLACSAAALIYFWARGALAPLFDDMWVYPFTSYRDAATAWFRYAAGSELRIFFWTDRPPIMRAAVRLLCELPAALLPVATALALAAGSALAIAAVARRRGRMLARPSFVALVRMAFPATLAAAAVPLLLGVSVRDLSHMAFAVPLCATALVCVLYASPRPQGRWGALLAVTRTIVGLGLVAALALSALFHMVNRWQPGRAFANADDTIRDDCHVAFLEHATAPEDTVVVLPAGGFHYLLSSRRSAIPFSILFRDRSASPWSQWSRAGRAMAAQPPSVVLATAAEFEDLTREHPELAGRYFGDDGAYLLDQRRPGPRLPPDSTWHFEIVDGGGRLLQAGTWRMINADAGPRLQVLPPASPGAAFVGRIDADRVVLLPPGQKVAARLSPDGRLLEGTIGPRFDCRVMYPRASPNRFVAWRAGGPPAAPDG
jgi:hypothetical protein